MASNRQTRFLAHDDESNDCRLYKPENKKRLLLNAKRILKGMSYFALTEYDELSRRLFDKTFQNSFLFEKFKESKSVYKYKTYNFTNTLDKKLVRKIEKLNDLDLELYAYAKKLFFDRLKSYGIYSS